MNFYFIFFFFPRRSTMGVSAKKSLSKTKSLLKMPKKKNSKEKLHKTGKSKSSVKNKEPDVTIASNRYKKVRESIAYGLENFESEEYFHGFIAISEVTKVLMDEYRKTGDFLVRKLLTREKGEGMDRCYVIHVRGEKLIHEIPIRYSRTYKVYYVYENCFTTPGGLIAYHSRQGVAVKSEVYLCHPVPVESWEVNHEQICKTKSLGDGAFGEVFKGIMRVGFFKTIPVAVKVNNDQITDIEAEKLMLEAMLMKTLNHPNTVGFIGAAMHDRPVMIVMELCKGSVLDAVQKSDKIPVEQGLRFHWCHGIAKGLSFLVTKSVIHRDLAARNSLIGFNNEAKISDFGLSMVAAKHKEKKLKNVPVRYLAPESLNRGEYSIATDMWSYAVFMWEVFNDGKVPYSEIDDIKLLKKKLNVGYRLKPGPKYPKPLWDLTKSCFEKDPTKRPTADECEIVCEALYTIETVGIFKRIKVYTVTDETLATTEDEFPEPSAIEMSKEDAKKKRKKTK